MVRKHLVGQYCENKVFGLSNFVDDFGYSILHHLMQNNFVHNNEVDFWYDFYLYDFYFVEKMGNFPFVLVTIVVDHENLLNLKSVVVYFDFVKRNLSICFRFCCFWSIYIVVIMFCKIFSM